MIMINGSSNHYIARTVLYPESLPIIGPPIAMVKTMGSNIKLALVML